MSWFQRELDQLPPDVVIRLEGRLAGVFDELYADADDVDLECVLRESLRLDRQVLVAAQLLCNSMERKPTLPELLVQLDYVHRRTSAQRMWREFCDVFGISPPIISDRDVDERERLGLAFLGVSP